MNLLGISGALRAQSTNTLLVQEAARLFAPAQFTLADIRFALFDEDLQNASGIPAEVSLLAAQIRGADAVIVSTPEYNKSIPGVLKNALDWLSRTEGAPLRDKPMAIMSATDGRSGGERAQFALRHCLFAFEPRLIYKPEVLIGASRSAFDDEGRLKDLKARGFLERQMEALRALAG